MSDLGTLGGTISSAYGINDSGQVVGASFGQAFLYSGGVMSALPGGTNGSYANDINNNGQTVGAYFTSAGETRAALFSDGAFTDLSLLMAGTGWTLFDARAINDAGQIVGYGTNPQGQTRAFLMTPVTLPVPLPTAFWLFGSALAALGLTRKHRKV